MNTFLFEDVKRFYVIEHLDTDIVRAWQGHKQEQKWFYVVKGVFKVVVVEPDNWVTPIKAVWMKEFILDADEPRILAIPGGFVNGLKAQEPDSRIIVYSDFSLEESAQDDFRFDLSLWYNWEVDKIL